VGISTLQLYIPDDKIAEIKESSNIVQLISEYVPLKKVGTNYKGLCPFHSEKEPSFIVSEAKQIFHCFGCGIGGNVFTFLMKFENLSFPEATKRLAQKYGIKLPQKEPSLTQKKLMGEKEKLFKLNELATEYYSNLLNQTLEGERARKYLKKRGISEKTIIDYKLGFASHNWDGLLKFLKKRKVPLELAQKIGLLKPGKKSELYDFFRDRIIFPIINYNQRIIGFGGRAISDDSYNKYINSSDSIIYRKGNSLYGLNITLSFIRKENFVILVEGYFDLLSLHQYGIKNAVATLGTALTDGQIKLLKRFTRNMAIAFDTDESGIKATIKSLPIFLENGVSPKIVLLPLGIDPDSFIHKEKKEGFKKKLYHAIPLMEFFINKIINQNDTSTINGKLTIMREVSPILSKLSDTTERNLYIQRLSQQIDVGENVIRSEIYLEKQQKTEAKEIYINAPDQHRVEEFLLQLMILQPEVLPQVKQAAVVDDLNEPKLKRLLFFIIDYFDHNQSIEPDRLINQLEDEDSKNLVAKLVIKGESIIDIPKTLKNSIQKLKEMSIRKEIRSLNIKIKEAQQGKDENAMKRFLLHKQKLLERKKKYTSDQFSIHLQ
jgi:DNA primase